MHRIDAVIATNTTAPATPWPACPTPTRPRAVGQTGARGVDPVIRELARHLKNEVPIVGVGGILSAMTRRKKITAGASLVQLYSGLSTAARNWCASACSASPDGMKRGARICLGLLMLPPPRMPRRPSTPSSPALPSRDSRPGNWA